MIKKCYISAFNGLLTLISVALFSTVFASCADDFDLPAMPESTTESGYITLTIKCGDIISRAEEPGIDALNENKINSVTLLISSNEGDHTDSDAPVYRETFTDLNVNNQAILRVPLTMELKTRLFGVNNSNSCRVFAAVNVDPGEAETVADLRALAVTSKFNTDKVQADFTMDGDGTITYTPQGNYATGEVTVQRSAAKITLALDVDQSVEETVNGETLTWVPDLSGMRVTLQQGVWKSNLDPRPEPNMTGGVYFNSANDLVYNFTQVTRPEGDKYAKYDREQDVPFYTYPNKWTGSVEERHGTFMMLSVPWSSDGGQSYRTCYYHVPIIPNHYFELARNISYHVMLHVGVLGSFVPEEPFEIEGDYYVADWGKEDINVDIKDYRYLVVDQHDYVVNNEESITIPFYTSHKTIVTDVKMKFYRYNFSDQGSEFAVEVTPAQNKLSATNSTSKTDSVYSCVFNNSNNNLVLEHSLNVWAPYNASNQEVSLTKGLDKGAIANVRDAEGRYYYDNEEAMKKVLATIAYFKEKANDGEYSRIEYEVTVQHCDVVDGTSGIDKNLYKETVTITQYPGMYITTVQNYCKNLGQNTTANANLGNTFINGNTSGSSANWNSQVAENGNGDVPTSGVSNWGNQRKIAYNYTNWCKSIGLGSQKQGYYNWNPNLYLVTITQLDQELGKKYKIDDPRSYNINNYLANDDAYEGYTVDGGSNRQYTTEYWYYQVGNNDKGPETSSAFNTVFKGQNNPLDFQASVNKDSWNEYIKKGWVSAPALSGASPRTLQYYYPTMENDNNKMTIAPKFRICSSYAGTRSQLTREMARRRAAAYQELGYCAGRWRLPTYGEVEYIMILAAELKIPRLFGVNNATNQNNDWAYWCAQGAVVVPPGNADNKNPYLTTTPNNQNGSSAVAPFTGNNYRARSRFVYDEWYWGSETLTPSSATPNENSPTYTFTWGDRVKSSPIQD